MVSNSTISQELSVHLNVTTKRKKRKIRKGLEVQVILPSDLAVNLTWIILIYRIWLGLQLMRM